jgi:hypothetical protein
MDYIKFDKRRGMFLENCPEMVVVDEAHTCARPAGTKSLRQQQRHHLLHEIGKNPAQHLVMLTATPHSGKTEEFQSLLALLRPEFGQFALEQIGQNERRKIARHFIQRKRSNIRRWMQETTLFPERIPDEHPYRLSALPTRLSIGTFSLCAGHEQSIGQRSTANSASSTGPPLPCCAASSLQPGGWALEMLHNRATTASWPSDDATGLIGRPGEPRSTRATGRKASADAYEAELLEQTALDEAGQLLRFRELAQRVEQLRGLETDHKAAEALHAVRAWLADGFNPIVYCRYIATAQYLGELLREALPAQIAVETVTSELDDEQRREKVEALKEHPKRVLVATDCLSEGINLQEHFTAVLHYDLPWNPNRLEQREGRVDRFGQPGRRSGPC